MIAPFVGAELVAGVHVRGMLRPPELHKACAPQDPPRNCRGDKSRSCASPEILYPPSFKPSRNRRRPTGHRTTYVEIDIVRSVVTEESRENRFT